MSSPNQWWRFRKHSHNRKGSWGVWHVAAETGQPICRTQISRYATFGWEEQWGDLAVLPETGRICPTCRSRWQGDVVRGAITPGKLPLDMEATS